MDLRNLSRALELRFACTCRIGADAPGDVGAHEVVRIRYDTPWVPHTWEEFVRFDDQTRANMLEFLRLELGISEAIDFVIEHVARVLRLRWLPVGTCGVMQVPEPPLYFERTHQLDKYRTDQHIYGREFSGF